MKRIFRRNYNKKTLHCKTITIFEFILNLYSEIFKYRGKFISWATLTAVERLVAAPMVSERAQLCILPHDHNAHYAPLPRYYISGLEQLRCEPSLKCDAQIKEGIIALEDANNTQSKCRTGLCCPVVYRRTKCLTSASQPLHLG